MMPIEMPVVPLAAESFLCSRELAVELGVSPEAMSAVNAALKFTNLGHHVIRSRYDALALVLSSPCVQAILPAHGADIHKLLEHFFPGPTCKICDGGLGGMRKGKCPACGSYPL